MLSAPAALALLYNVALAVAFPTTTGNLLKHTAEPGDEPDEKIGSEGFFLKLGLSAVLVLLGGAFAGLTIGLMGLDPLHLQVLANAADDPKERANAKVVLKLMRKGKHWVLVTLLLCNVVVNESLPIFLDSAIGGGIAAILISTATIVVFGIIPQAVCARYGLAIGAKSATPVLIVMYILSPIAYPIAKLLDWALGKEGPTTYKKAELKSFLQFHRNSSLGSYTSPTEESPLPLTDEEISILNGVLGLSEKRVTDIMTPMHDVVTLSADQILDHNMVDKILTSGYSRFPVHEPHQPLSFRGFLLVKKLLLYDPSQPKRVGDFRLTILPEAKPNISCFQALDYFQTGRSHLLLISKTPGQSGGALGVVTLEDIIEEIISEEIVDETDVYEDMHTKRRAKRQSTAAIMRGIVERENVKRRMSDSSFAGSTTASQPGTPLAGGAGPFKPGEANEQTRLLSPIAEGSGGSTASTPKASIMANGEDYVNAKGGEPNGNGYGSVRFSESPPKL
ncbi:hypothetical protein M407DRAFT_65336 [Tulasnella calospora MUT 4182]|uniref:CNNM transmembrane domain-containing protein n=1 Tax=Tulasnella calospora MUT 4182 TaxID=1051891 RepID=A0A0C3LHZ7_9AGAM|nr:hypothetical protein M407DRAFT_65336 [Tulasnella calospora MUT 4182]